MSLLFSIPSTLPSHLATEMPIALRTVMETVVKTAGLEISGAEILGGLGSLFSAFFYIGIQQNLCIGRVPSCDNRRPDWTKYYSPRSTREGLTPALA
jgi:hypothetical protein